MSPDHVCLSSSVRYEQKGTRDLSRADQQSTRCSDSHGVPLATFPVASSGNHQGAAEQRAAACILASQT
jgi:hypothetical protein